MSVCERSPFSASSRSSSSRARSRASSRSRSSRSAGSSIACTRKSPSSSISTTAWRAAPGVFLYAASRPSSSAFTSTPSSMPFSRSSARTASMISRLMSIPRSVVDQVSPHDRVVRDLHRLGSSGCDLQAALTRRDQLAAKTLAAAELRVGAELDLSSHRPLEVRGLAQRPLAAGGGHVDRVVAQVRAEHVGDPFAERMVDALGMVDEHDEALGPCELECENLYAGNRPFHRGRDLPKELLF